MASQSKQPIEPVGIELLLELLNASEGVVARRSLTPGGAATQTVEAVDLPADIADVETPADLDEVEVPTNEADDAENRFAAHIVRGMSKSKVR